MDGYGDQASWNSSDDGRVEKEAEDSIAAELDLGDMNCLHAFENCSAAITHLHRERLRNDDSWSVFQTAAGCVTSLYRESVEIRKKAFELGIKMGYLKKNKELRMWARKYKQRQISKDELMSCLPGMSPTSNKSRTSPQRTKAASRTPTFDFNQSPTPLASTGMGFMPTSPNKRDSRGPANPVDLFNHPHCDSFMAEAPRTGEKRGRNQFDESMCEPAFKRRPPNM